MPLGYGRTVAGAMAVYFLRCRHLSRGKGARVTRAAAYRACAGIRNERTREAYDPSNRQDVAHREALTPSGLLGRGAAIPRSVSS